MRTLTAGGGARGVALALSLTLFGLLVMGVMGRPILLAPALGLCLGAACLRRMDWIGYAVIVVAFTRGDAWVSGLTGAPAGSMIVLGVLIAIVIVALFTDRRLTPPNAAFYSMTLFFLSAFLVSVLLSDTTYAALWLRDALYALLAFTAIYLFTDNDSRLRNACRVIIACGVLLAVTNIAEIFLPSLNLSHSEGRAAGLMKNANTSAFVVTCSYVVLQFYQRWNRDIPPIALTAMQILLFAGVLATMSRGGMMLMTLAVVGSLASSTSTRRRTLATFLAIGLTVVVIAGALKVLQRSADIPLLLSLQKVSTFLSGTIDDNHRFYLAKYYFLRFLERPFVGYGFHATVLPSAANTDLNSFFGIKGPHNTPITMLVEFGMLPFLCYASFFAASFLRIRSVADAHARHHLFLLLAILAVSNVFAHDMHLSRPTLVLFAILAVAPEALSLNSPDDRSITSEWPRWWSRGLTSDKEHS